MTATTTSTHNTTTTFTLGDDQQKQRQVAVSDTPHRIIIRDEPVPQPSGTQVLVRIEASGVCATDLHLVRRSIPYLTPQVAVCGHEGIGRIVQLGPEVNATKWKVGDRVAHRWIYRVCRECEPCKSGNEQLCDRRQLSGKDVEGCWADYTLVDSEYMLPIPEEVKAAEAAPILCAGTTVYRALKSAQLAPGQWVAIVGAGGGLGHLAIQYAKAKGLKVLGIDGGEDKGALCTKLGADAFDLTADVIQTTQGGAHGVLVTSSSPRAYEQALTYVRKMGVLICIGITPQKMTFPIGPEYFVAKGVRLTGTSTGTFTDTQEALEYLRTGQVKPIVVEKKLGEIQECLDQLEKGDAVGRPYAMNEFVDSR
ncbi:Alcohol dehydrogenase [Rasamsonia emersonii CBS 393.64]|uniref:Alcohol dehydrogenase n=1 Tax=Rasamsonia emersonii (strain ATCC 16479 / CBS 393.64 / IMI 116815) TaxID=1408163 RepID=A0A0F4YKC4_RASE3|nr:Alcohol dehydrogenase [Rasamsonia emersonii CBS 393.64]KKA18311.1 Alcohol dehydrogenase [Rasamsonia emersonii CBS 393.64]